MAALTIDDCLTFLKTGTLLGVTLGMKEPDVIQRLGEPRYRAAGREDNLLPGCVGGYYGSLELFYWDGVLTSMAFRPDSDMADETPYKFEVLFNALYLNGEREAFIRFLDSANIQFAIRPPAEYEDQISIIIDGGQMSFLVRTPA